VFDNRRERFLDSVSFGVLGTGWRPPVRPQLLLAFTMVLACDCSSQRPPGTVEDTLTSGRISVVCAPEVLPVIAREVAVFDSLYPAASIVVKSGSSREAVRALFAAECDLAVITRDLEPEERGAAVRGRLELEGYPFAKDGLVIVVHPANPVENIALEDVRGIYQGEIRHWDAVGGTRTAIEPVIQTPGSDVAAFFEQRVMNGEPVEARVVYETSDSGVVAEVSRRPEAIGFVSMAWADRGVKALRVASLKGLSYWRPDPEAVHGGDYPLTRPMNLYVRPRGPALANGLITFITSRDGQVVVHEEGLVPTAIPVRFVRRSPMLGSHR